MKNNSSQTGAEKKEGKMISVSEVSPFLKCLNTFLKPFKIFQMKFLSTIFVAHLGYTLQSSFVFKSKRSVPSHKGESQDRFNKTTKHWHENFKSIAFSVRNMG